MSWITFSRTDLMIAVAASLLKDASDLQRHIASGAPQVTPDKIGKIAVLLQEKLRYGPPELRQAYARLVMDDVSVTDGEIRISGSKSVLARCAAADAMPAAPAVLSFVQEWRAGEDEDENSSRWRVVIKCCPK